MDSRGNLESAAAHRALEWSQSLFGAPEIGPGMWAPPCVNFYQVEADVAQLDVKNPFALF